MGCGVYSILYMGLWAVGSVYSGLWAVGYIPYIPGAESTNVSCTRTRYLVYVGCGLWAVGLRIRLSDTRLEALLNTRTTGLPVALVRYSYTIYTSTRLALVYVLYVCTSFKNPTGTGRLSELISQK